MKSLANYFYEIGSLRKIARSHRQRFLTDDLSDNIASHSHRVAAIGWFLAEMEKADPYKVLTMCTFHDSTESRSGDINWVHKKYVKVFEEEIVEDQTKKLKGGKKLKEILEEYEKRSSKEAKIAKDADVLDQLLLCREYQAQGNSVANHWLRNRKRWTDRMHSKSARKLVTAIFEVEPKEWTEDVSTSERR